MAGVQASQTQSAPWLLWRGSGGQATCTWLLLLIISKWPWHQGTSQGPLEEAGGGLAAQWCLTLCDPMDYVACRAPLSMGFSRQETGVGSHFLLQEIFPTRGSNLRLLNLLHCRQFFFLLLSHQGSPLDVPNGHSSQQTPTAPARPHPAL